MWHTADKKRGPDICFSRIHTSSALQSGLYSNLKPVEFSTFSSIILQVKLRGNSQRASSILTLPYSMSASCPHSLIPSCSHMLSLCLTRFLVQFSFLSDTSLNCLIDYVLQWVFRDHLPGTTRHRLTLDTRTEYQKGDTCQLYHTALCTSSVHITLVPRGKIISKQTYNVLIIERPRCSNS